MQSPRSTPSVAPAPAAPQQSQAEIVTASRGAAGQARQRTRRRQGRQDTILTEPQGLTEEANISRKTILGQ